MLTDNTVMSTEVNARTKKKRVKKNKLRSQDLGKAHASENKKKVNQGKRKRVTDDSLEDQGDSRKIQSQRDQNIDSDDESPTKKPKEPSKRQKKRDKAMQMVAQQREASKLETTQKALNYLSKWKHARSEWKFEKLRQIWLTDHLLDDKSVPDSMFTIALEYFEGSKGMARTQLIKKMMDVIKKVEDQQQKENKDEDGDDEKIDATQSPEYQRARQIVQALPIDIS